MSAPALERVTFSTPRDSGYTKIETLEKLTGQRAAEFGHVILKELIDNSLDECENAGAAPEVSVTVSAGGDGIKFLTVEDNGRGFPAATVAGFCDFNKSASDKSAYRSPTRGAQGSRASSPFRSRSASARPASSLRRRVSGTKSAGQDGWRKWPPCRPTSPHWYDSDALTGLISAYLAAGSDKALGMFVREFDGLTSTAKARKVAAVAAGVKSLSGFKGRPDRIGALLTEMTRQSRPVKAAALGIVPEEHYRLLIARLFGISHDRCWAARKEILHRGIPWAVDVVVAETERPGRVIYSTNFGVTFGDPPERASLRSGTWYDTRGAESFLRHAGAYPDDGNDQLRAAVVHVQCAAPRWTDTGKVALIVPADVEATAAEAFAKATKTLREERERLKKDADKEQRRQDREAREWQEQRRRAEREPPLKDAVRDLLTQAAEMEGEPFTRRRLYDMTREALTEVTSRPLTWRNFRQILDSYEGERSEIPGLVRTEEPAIVVDLARHPRGPTNCRLRRAISACPATRNCWRCMRATTRTRWAGRSTSSSGAGSPPSPGRSAGSGCTSAVFTTAGSPPAGRTRGRSLPE